MAWHIRTMASLGLVLVLIGSSVPASAQNAAPTVAPPPPLELPADLFAGVWIYNEEESINAATGRRERSPRSATQRVPVGRGGGSPTVTAPQSVQFGGQQSRSGGMGPGVTGITGQLGPTVAMIQENRSLQRDLLEVPESLKIGLAPGSVTFTDDLERQRAYATTGVRSRYQLGAARFNASLEWNGTQLVKKIDGADGFRMTETYFLSEDGRRLFVIVRVGSDRKDAPVMGVNRVYDRIDGGQVDQ